MIGYEFSKNPLPGTFFSMPLLITHLTKFLQKKKLGPQLHSHFDIQQNLSRVLIPNGLYRYLKTSFETKPPTVKMWCGVRSHEGAPRGSTEQVKEDKAIRGRPLNWNCLQVFNCMALGLTVLPSTGIQFYGGSALPCHHLP